MNNTVNVSPYAIAPNVQRPLLRALRLGAFLRRQALAASVLLIGAVGAALAQPVLIAWVIDRGVLQQDTDALRLSVILLLGAVVAERVPTVGYQLVFA